MKIALSALAASLAASSVLAQEPKKPQAPPSQMTAPKIGPEHEILREEVGDWDATVETLTPPGIPASKGEEKCTLMGGLWIITDFRGEMAGHPFYGHGTMGYDSTKKKYVSSWIDSMSTSIGIGESTYDPAKKTMVGVFEGPDETGKMIKMRSVVEWKNGDTRVFTMSVMPPDGKELPVIRITYKRRK